MSAAAPPSQPPSRFVYGSFVLFFFLLIMLTGCGDEVRRRGGVAPPPPPGAVASGELECVAIRTTLVSDSHMPAASALLYYEFENHCELAVEVDWASVIATGCTATPEDACASPVALALHDAHHRVDIGRLDGMVKGAEALRYDAKVADASFNRVCIDFSRVANTVKGNRSAVCVEKPGDSNVVQTGKSGFREAHDDEHESYGPSFGNFWDSTGLPRLRFDAGFSMHSFSLQGRKFGPPNTNANIEVPGEAIGQSVTAGTFDMRLTGFVHGPFYTGFEMGVGFGGTRGVVVQEDPRVAISDSSPSGHILFAGLLGVAGRAGIVQPHAEIALGGRILVFETTTDPACTSGCTSSVMSASWMVEPRAGLDFWVHPNLTVGAYAGFDALHTQDVSGGVMLGIHLRSFDGH